MENKNFDYKSIPGWAIDADPKDQPNYPIKHYTGDDHKRLNWDRPTQQKESVEILKSVERPSVSAVFGTSAPPSGLSGALRRKAFKFSESEYGHWLNLLLADRINVVEGILQDLAKGHIPNIFAEKGWGADLKVNKKGLVKNVLILAGVAAALTVIFSSNGNKKKSFAS